MARLLDCVIVPTRLQKTRLSPRLFADLSCLCRSDLHLPLRHCPPPTYYPPALWSQWHLFALYDHVARDSQSSQRTRHRCHCHHHSQSFGHPETPRTQRNKKHQTRRPLCRLIAHHTACDTFTPAQASAPPLLRSLRSQVAGPSRSPQQPNQPSTRTQSQHRVLVVGITRPPHLPSAVCLLSFISLYRRCRFCCSATTAFRPLFHPSPLSHANTLPQSLDTAQPRNSRRLRAPRLPQARVCGTHSLFAPFPARRSRLHRPSSLLGPFGFRLSRPPRPTSSSLTQHLGSPDNGLARDSPLTHHSPPKESSTESAGPNARQTGRCRPLVSHHIISSRRGHLLPLSTPCCLVVHPNIRVSESRRQQPRSPPRPPA